MCRTCSFPEVGPGSPVSVGAGQGEGLSPPGERWARLVVDVPGPLSLGMWYRVLSAGPEEAVVVVHHHPAIVPRRSLEIVSTRPSRYGNPSLSHRRVRHRCLTRWS